MILMLTRFIFIFAPASASYTSSCILLLFLFVHQSLRLFPAISSKLMKDVSFPKIFFPLFLVVVRCFASAASLTAADCLYSNNHFKLINDHFSTPDASQFGNKHKLVFPYSNGFCSYLSTLLGTIS